MTTLTGVNVTTSEQVATRVRSIEGSERVTDLPRPDLPAPSAVACPSDHARQATATTARGQGWGVNPRRPASRDRGGGKLPAPQIRPFLLEGWPIPPEHLCEQGPRGRCLAVRGAQKVPGGRP